jgi:hypothetical protein
MQGVGSEATGEQFDAIESSLGTLLDEKVICVSAQAIELAYDYANLLRRSNVLTDIVPSIRCYRYQVSLKLLRVK